MVGNGGGKREKVVGRGGGGEGRGGRERDRADRAGGRGGNRTFRQVCRE